MQIGSFLELLLLSLALADRLVYLRKEREGLLEQSRFFAIGQAIGNIGHQWKIPLTQVATISTMIESTLKHDRSKLSSNIEKALPDLKLSIEQMKETLAEFSQFYRTKRDKKTFSPYQVLQKNVIQLLSSKIMLKNVQINLDFDADFTMTNYEHIFANIMMILIDNSIDAFDKNHNNKITILITRHKDHLVLNYSDNAGGIKVKPIEKVFEYFISTKEKEGHGLGLPMVKMLVEERMNGSITLKNISDGVQFTIHFPY
jgi:C4-dicarboxylate-specific signal transduction histidine kinase